MVRLEGLEPPRAYCPHGPEPCASTNSATAAIRSQIYEGGLVRPTGLEPVQGFPYSALNAARLPIPPRPRCRTFSAWALTRTELLTLPTTECVNNFCACPYFPSLSHSPTDLAKSPKNVRNEVSIAYKSIQTAPLQNSIHTQKIHAFLVVTVSRVHSLTPLR